MSLNCVIVDDNDIDRLMVISFVKRFPQLTIAGVFDAAETALPFIMNGNIDLLFLDIDMPEMNGLELRKLVPDIPACIFITAHAEHALDSFEVQTFDFLVKPLRFERFEQTIHRVEEYFAILQKATLFETEMGGDTIFIKEGHQQIKLNLRDILYLEALKDYTLIVTSQKRHCVLSSIGNLLTELPFKSFIRVHRSFAVQKQYIQTISASEIRLTNQKLIPVGRTYKDQLQEML